MTMHTLRHSYATHLLERKVSIHAIQRYLGHTCLETTMILRLRSAQVYLHLTADGQKDAVERINGLIGDL